ncbi:MAG: acyl-CoA dehydrogenase family protein [Actinobacteria bacterium]|nr:acyl-CoA dehydrogenase family protein [Cyanobacteriota bacterium]MCL5771012.1 acyl-CoA dehydrogenase family protein [Actinomycetota bacterium]
MRYLLTEEQKMIVEICRRIVEERIIPVRAELDEKMIFPAEIIAEIGRSDLFRLFIPEKYGGMGTGIFEVCLATEELSRGDLSVATTYAASGLGFIPIILMGSEEQKERYLPQLASGEKLAAFGLTEADAGSDVSAIRTTAVKDGNYYILNGTKQWITNGGEADIYTVFAKTDPSRGARGVSAFIVEKGTEGFEFGKKENKLGIRASATRELIFNDCKVPKENLISKEGMGFIIIMKTFDQSRPAVGAQAVGVAQAALEEALNYSKIRFQFDSSISSFQAIQHMLADMATNVEAARSLVYYTAQAIDNGEKDISRLSAMSKLFASDMAMKVTTDAVQIFGGYGFMKDYPVEKMMRDAKITQIYEGTNQIQRNIIALDLIKKGFI